jgi:AraC-like DNA-binding protein
MSAAVPHFFVRILFRGNGRSSAKRYFYHMGNWGMLINFVLVAGMTLIVIIITFLLRFRKQLPYRLLSLFFASIFLFLLYYFGYLHRSRYIGGIAFLLGNGMCFLWGPLFLHYIQSLVFPKKRVLRSLTWQLIPFGLNALFISIPRGLNMFSDALFPELTEWYLPKEDYFMILENVYVTVYFFICLGFIGRLNVLQGNSYSDTEGKDLAWCRKLIVALIAIVLLDIGFSVYEMNFPMIEWNIGMVPAFLFVGLSGFFAYKGMWQAQVLLPEFLLEPAAHTVASLPVEIAGNGGEPQQELPVAEPVDGTVVVAGSWALAGLSEQEIAALKTRLYEVLDTEKPYLNDSLTLADLAALIPISDKKLSELLNRHVCISFYDLINNYRVETVKEKMCAPLSRQYTLLAIAFDSGFKSKTSFNRVFKQKTGLSPSQYYESCRSKIAG